MIIITYVAVRTENNNGYSHPSQLQIETAFFRIESSEKGTLLCIYIYISMVTNEKPSRSCISGLYHCVV